MNIALSHNGGTNFTTGATNTATFAPGADQTLSFPVTSPTNCDDFGRTWTQSELSDANFRLRAMPAGATQATAFIDIDRIRIRVCYDGSNLAEAAAAAQLNGGRFAVGDGASFTPAAPAGNDVPTLGRDDLPVRRESRLVVRRHT